MKPEEFTKLLLQNGFKIASVGGVFTWSLNHDVFGGAFASTFMVIQGFAMITVRFHYGMKKNANNPFYHLVNSDDYNIEDVTEEQVQTFINQQKELYDEKLTEVHSALIKQSQKELEVQLGYRLW